jgi:type II secretory pathway pseudopilin PulG
MKPLVINHLKSQVKSRLAFSRLELLVTVAALSLLAAAIVAPLVTSRRAAQRTRCAANLQQINQAVLSFSNDHTQTLPGLTPGLGGELWWWYKESVKRYVGLNGPSSTNDLVFACPNDRGYTDPIPFHHNARFDYSSYVYNGVTLPGAPNIAGWQVASVKQPQRTLMVMEWTAHAPLSWHKSRTGRNNAPFYSDALSMVGFVDGHVSFSKIYYNGCSAAYLQDPIVGYEYKYSGN